MFSLLQVDEEVPVISRARREVVDFAEQELSRYIRSAEEEESEGGGLADLGICFGDILPAIREKYPNENLTITVHSSKTPAVIFSKKDGATGRLHALAQVFVGSTGEKVGTVAIDFEVVVTIETNGKLK